MSDPAKKQKMDESHRWEKVAALESDVSGLKREVGNISTELGNLDKKFDAGLNKLYDTFNAGRGTNWTLIFGVLGIAASITVALATWANAYFGQSIASAQREAMRTMEMQTVIMGQIERIREDQVEARVSAAILTERSETTRAEIDRLREGVRIGDAPSRTSPFPRSGP